MKALRRAGWSVLVIPEWEYVPVKWRTNRMRVIGRAIRRDAVRELSAALVRAAEQHDPELLLVFKGMFVTADALDTLRRRGVRAYCFYPDVSTRTHGPYLPDALPAYDLVFTTKSFGLADLRALGVGRVELLPHAFDPDLHRPLELTSEDCARYGCDVSFIGTWSPKKENLLATLAERTTATLRVWGAQWDRARAPVLQPAIAGMTVDGDEYVRAILASKINLALLSERRDGASDGDQITSRTFHIPAAGGFMLHERTTEVLALLEEGRSVACFGSADELVEKVSHYLDASDARRAIAACGTAIVRAGHSWDQRIAQLLAFHQPAPRA